MKSAVSLVLMVCLVRTTVAAAPESTDAFGLIHRAIARGIGWLVSPAIGGEPERIQSANCIVHGFRELGPVAEDPRIVQLVEKEPAADEDPFKRRRMPAVQQPLDGLIRQEIDGRRTIGILNEAAVCGHPSGELALPGFLERLLKPVEEGQRTFLTAFAGR
jgi:hypothetical protein